MLALIEVVDENCLTDLRELADKSRNALQDSIEKSEKEYQDAIGSLKDKSVIEFISLAKEDILLTDCISIGNKLMESYRRLRQRYFYVSVFKSGDIERVYSHLCASILPKTAIKYLNEMIRLCELKVDLLCIMDMYHRCYSHGIEVVIKHNNN